jgi:acetyl-CoA carboxylase/biotin carboxylase 1
MGTLVSFPNFPALSRGFEKVTSVLPLFEADEYRQRYGYNNQPPNIMNLALRIFDKKDDMTKEAWSEKITALINQRRGSLNKRGIRCVSVLICRQGQYLFFYTLRESNSVWGDEEQAIRNIEPALAFQLEPSCLSNYKLTPCFGESQQIHIYHAVASENQLDNRFIIRPGRLRGTMSTAEGLISETDRLVTSVLDALEVVSAQHRTADCNHIFMNFVYTGGDGKKLWRLHVTSSEICIALEDGDGNVTPVHCIIEVSCFVVN